jgi:hypothetical protein
MPFPAMNGLKGLAFFVSGKDSQRETSRFNKDSQVQPPKGDRATRTQKAEGH